MAVNLFTVFSRRLSDNDQKYLLPIFTSLPLLLGFFLEGFRKRGRWLAALLLGLLVFLQALGQLPAGRLGAPSSRRNVNGIQPASPGGGQTDRGTLRRGIHRLYTDEALGLKLTFLSGERIIGTDAYQGIYSEICRPGGRGRPTPPTCFRPKTRTLRPTCRGWGSGIGK